MKPITGLPKPGVLASRTARWKRRPFWILAVVVALSLEAGAASSAGGGQELEEDYWIVGRWEEADSDVVEDSDAVNVVVDWGLSEDDLEGWEDLSVPEGPPYRRSEGGAGFYYDRNGEQLTLWDIERYRLDDRTHYAAVWRKLEDTDDEDSSLLDMIRLGPGCLSTGCEIGAPSGYAGYELVDFELEEVSCETPELRGVWRAGDRQGVLRLRAMTLSELVHEDLAHQVVDIELCEPQDVGDFGSAQFLILLDTSAEVRKTVVGHGDWCRLHDAFHLLEIPETSRPCGVRTLELESIKTIGVDGLGTRECPVVKGDASAETSAWEYLWVWQPDQARGDQCDGDKRDWLMATDRYSLLEREVGCLKGDQEMGGFYADELCKKRRKLHLIDIIIGVDGAPDSDGDSQHPLGHGDGSGG
jgi:hypothetical protein